MPYRDEPHHNKPCFYAVFSALAQRFAQKIKTIWKKIAKRINQLKHTLTKK